MENRNAGAGPSLRPPWLRPRPPLPERGRDGFGCILTFVLLENQNVNIVVLIQFGFRRTANAFVKFCMLILFVVVSSFFFLFLLLDIKPLG